MTLRHPCGSLECGDRLFELSGRSEGDAERPVRQKRFGVQLNGPPLRLDRLVPPAGCEQTGPESRRDVRGQRIAVERSASFCDAPLEVPTGPLEIEERVPAAAHPVARTDLQR